MMRLSELSNIGKVVEEKLKEVGIETPQQLNELGAEQSFIRLQAIDERACYNMLCALEGAIQGIRWHNLSKERKEGLKDFLKMTRVQKNHSRTI